MLCVAMCQFYQDVMEVSDDVKTDTAADSKTNTSTSPDSNKTADATSVSDTNDVEMKTEGSF